MSSHKLTKAKQEGYLQAMGIQAWHSRRLSSGGVDEMSVGARVPECVVEAEEAVAESSIGEPLLPIENDVAPAGNQRVPGEVVVPVTTGVDVSQLDWSALQAAVATCTTCALHESRTKTVFGVGDQQAQVMVIGEAPGAEEDRQGEPFVGPAGMLLNNMLLAMGYKRDQVYIANIVKCRPPGNRDPQPDEATACESYLQRQIALVDPRIILIFGRIAAHNLLKVDAPIGKMRGKQYEYGGIPVVVTFHPAYLLRKPSEKAKSWDDLRLALSIIRDGQDGARS